jgi:uroporphyrin-III C-methyltransferase
LTLVVYMGVSRVDAVVQALLDAGMASSTPAAVISAATTAQQRHAVCTLATLVAVIQQQALASPAVLVIGDVAAAGVVSLGIVEPAEQMHVA